jgi:bifunctional NMN adenylyltransferase/nudix hydrolase
VEYDYLVFVGRFEPFHNGHYAVVARALRLAKEVIVLIGSANKPRSIRNPWNVSEREVMIRAAFAADSNRIHVRAVRDHMYNDALWVSEVQRAVAEVTAAAGGAPRAGTGASAGATPPPEVGLIGHSKDYSSYYLAMFPQWTLVNAVNVAGVSATDLRDYLFAGAEPDIGKDLLIRAAVPEPVFAMLKGFREGPHFAQLVREHQFIRDYRKAWASAPYEPTFVTADAVVIHSGHVLLVRRRTEPGKGLWAFPGGFLNQRENLQTAAIRELKEETRLAISPAALASALKERHVFDHPERSLRGRTITHAFHFDFPTGELPHVIASDDAQSVGWVPVSEALQMEELFYEDHFHILEHFLGRV